MALFIARCSPCRFPSWIKGIVGTKSKKKKTKKTQKNPAVARKSRLYAGVRRPANVNEGPVQYTSIWRKGKV